MKVGEVGAGSGYLSRYIAEKVGPDGHAYANELEGRMVAYMNDRATKEGLKNFTALKGTTTSTGFQPESLDAVAVVYAFSFFDEREAMLKSIHASLKPGGALLIVDLPSEQVGSRMMGIDADDAHRACSRRRAHARTGERDRSRPLRADFQEEVTS